MHKPEAPPSSNSAAESRNGGTCQYDHPATDAVRRIFDRLGDLRAQATLYLEAERDRAKVTVRQAAIWAGLGILGLIVAGSLLAVATAYLVIGFAEAMRNVCDPHR